MSNQNSMSIQRSVTSFTGIKKQQLEAGGSKNLKSFNYNKLEAGPKGFRVEKPKMFQLQQPHLYHMRPSSMISVSNQSNQSCGTSVTSINSVSNKNSMNSRSD